MRWTLMPLGMSLLEDVGEAWCRSIEAITSTFAPLRYHCSRSAKSWFRDIVLRILEVGVVATFLQHAHHVAAVGDPAGGRISSAMADADRRLVLSRSRSGVGEGPGAPSSMAERVVVRRFMFDLPDWFFGLVAAFSAGPVFLAAVDAAATSPPSQFAGVFRSPRFGGKGGPKIGGDDRAAAP